MKLQHHFRVAEKVGIMSVPGGWGGLHLITLFEAPQRSGGPNPSQSIQDVNKDPKITELVCNESALLQISKLFTCPHITMSLACAVS